MRFYFWLVALLVAPLMRGEDKWTYVRSGPFEVWTDGSEKAARVRLVEAEQFRHALGQILGKDDLKSVWKIRLLALKNRKHEEASSLHRVRDLWEMTVSVDEPLPPEFRRDAGRILLNDNTHAFPQEIDQGLVDVLVPLEVRGTHLKLGVPETGGRNLGWARVHLFVSDPVFAGRAKVYFSTLESGADEVVAGRNAFEKPASELDGLVAAHLKEKDLPETVLPGRAISEKDFPVRSVSSEQAAVARADLGVGSYKDLTVPDAYESAGDPVKATEAGSKSATAWLAAAELEKDPSRMRPLILKAIELNPLWGEPHAVLARMESGAPAQAMVEWKKAAELDLRNVGYWQSYAEAASTTHQFNDAAKGWNGALRATASEDVRARLREARANLEVEKADYAVSARQKERDDREKDLERVKAEAMASIHAAEAKANAQLDKGKAPVEKGKLEEWWDGPGGPKQNGTALLVRLDCLKAGAKMLLKMADGKILTLLVKDPANVTILNSKEQTLACGVQNPPRKVAFEYQPSGKANVPGSLLTVEFQ